MASPQPPQSSPSSSVVAHDPMEKLAKDIAIIIAAGAGLILQGIH
jgi:hypothetical protein